MKIRPMGADLLHVGRRTDGRTDMTVLTDAFRDFTKALNLLPPELLFFNFSTPCI